MRRIFRSLGVAFALAAVVLGGCALPWSGSPVALAQDGGTPLPPGWELCVLQGLGAPATPANVADLDEWQAAEGGSTNNTAAYNPFNTRRITDATGTSIPHVVPSNAFPAFTDWPAGCQATVATLFQPTMWSITAALRGGNVTPPSAFLAVVDQSAWCAPSADGVPCYESKILGAGGDVAALVAHSSALGLYGNVKSDLQSYQLAVLAQAADQGVLTTRNGALAAAQSQLSAAQARIGAASRTLQRFAVAEYVSSGLYESDTLANPGVIGPLGPQTANGVVAHQYLSVEAAHLVAHDQAAAAALKASLAQRDAASKSVAQAASTLVSDQASEGRALTKMAADVASLQTAGACTTVTIPVPTATAGAPAPTTAANTPTTVPSTTVPPTTAPTTTVPTTVPPTTTVPSTTVPLTTDSTTTVPTTVPPPTTVPTTTTTTVPPTTTTTTVPAPAPGASAPTSAQPGIPAGVTALQGCVAALAPPASA